MPPSKRGLGRGLDALIPSADTEAKAGVKHIAPATIGRNPRQPRTRFDPTQLEELANSIREHGVIQPLIVAETAQAGRYVLIAGERRLEASKLAGLSLVPVIIREATDQQMLEVALIENIQRADLDAFETALAYKHLADDFNLSHEEIAQRVGKKRVSVTNTLRLLKLPQKILDALAEGQVTEGHARALLALPNPQSQGSALTTVMNKGLSVRQTEEYVRKLQGQREAKPATRNTTRHAEADALANKFRAVLGTKVTLKRGRKGGQIIIHYYSDEELNAVADVILKK